MSAENFHHANMAGWDIVPYLGDGKVQLKRVPEFYNSFLRNGHFNITFNKYFS